MSDYPTVPQPEANFMAAAEAAIVKLQGQADNAAGDAEIAAEAADRAEKSAKRWKKLTIVLAFFIVLSLVLSGLGVNLWLQQRTATSQLRQQAITSCAIGNDRAAGTVASMNQLITVLEGPHPTDKIKALATTLEDYILKHNQQRNCQLAYKPNAG